MENGFYFIFIALFVLKILKFLSWPFWSSLMSKILMSLTGKQIFTIHILQYLKKQRQPDNEIWSVKMRNIFLEKSYTKCGGKASLRSYLKKSKLNIYLDQQSEILYRLFLLYAQVEIYKNILKLSYWPFAFTLFEAFFRRQIEVWN